jgi:hypothetical protein
MRLSQARKILECLASPAILVDMECNNQTYYLLTPPIAGFFEFSMMRVRRALDQKVLSEGYS